MFPAVFTFLFGAIRFVWSGIEITTKNVRGRFSAIVAACCSGMILHTATIPGLLQLVVLFFIPESPRWLVSLGIDKSPPLIRLLFSLIDCCWNVGPDELKWILLVLTISIKLQAQL
ncbi:hypothetical protein HRI_000200100 [Hibiscus trionum]|uniref:Major facilitator superfamily (MFS) profile domain-containing protein n=1 Tax=Hibiscus trionum TaxID=183268 RepID=A0A9W7GTF0_HIBTR|nr:hypothetical protein HRI_000200100 [Hibiscus trionum]